MSAVSTAKHSLRADILARRRLLTRPALSVAANRLGDHLVPRVRASGIARVCAYLPVGSEPGSPGLLDALTAAGAEVLLPVLLPDADLDWAVYSGEQSLVDGPLHLREPSGPRLGVDAVRAAGLVLVPAVAVDRVGHRLGRGGGSYDRVLTRVAGHVPVVALLHDGELVDRVPVEAHDRPVSHAVTPGGGWQRLG